MPLGPVSLSTDYLHGTEGGCIRVAAVPHIIL